jgi:hypothetical protein
MKEFKKIALIIIFISIISCENENDFSKSNFSWKSSIENITKFRKTKFAFENKDIYKIELIKTKSVNFRLLDLYNWNNLYYDQGVIYSFDCALKNCDTCICFKKRLKNGDLNKNLIQSFYSEKYNEIIYRIKIKDLNPNFSGQFDNIILIGLRSGILGIYNIEKEYSNRIESKSLIKDAIGEVFTDKLK